MTDLSEPLAKVSEQTQSLGKLLNLKGTPDDKQKIWPIVQLADWGPTVDAEQIPVYAAMQPAS